MNADVTGRDRLQLAATVLFSVCSGLGLALFGAGLSYFIFYSVQAIAYPFEIDYVEGPMLEQADRLFRGLQIYRSIHEFPFVVANYPPLYHIVTNALRLGLDDPLTSGRVVSFVSTLVTAILLSMLMLEAVGRQRRRPARFLGTAFTALIYLSLAPVSVFAPVMRVDAFAVMLGFLGVWLFVRSLDRPGLLYVAAVVFVLAAYAKQTTIVGATVCLGLSLVLRPALTARALVLCIGLGLGILAYLSFASDGEFVRHVFQYNFNRFEISRLYFFLGDNLERYKYIHLVTLIFIVWGAKREGIVGACLGGVGRFRSHVAADRERLLFVLLAAYFILSLLSTLSVGKIGSEVNYFIEWMGVSSLILGITVARVTDFVLARGGEKKDARLSLMGSFLPLLLAWQFVSAGPQWHLLPSDEDRLGIALTLDAIRQAPGPVLSEDMTLLYKAGKPIAYQPTIMAQMSYQGLWDQEGLLARLRKREFALVIEYDAFREDRFTPEMKREILRQYPTVSALGKYRLYR